MFPFDFALAKTGTTYNGTDVHANWSVVDDLDLYFCTFVFPRTNNINKNAIKVRPPPNNSAVQHALWCVPCVQLCAAERYATFLRTNRHDLNSNIVLSLSNYETTITSPEKFVALWEEDPVTCSVAAMSHVPPVLSNLQAFHIETIVENLQD